MREIKISKLVNWMNNPKISKRPFSDTGSCHPAVAGVTPLVSRRNSDTVLKRPFWIFSKSNNQSSKSTSSKRNRRERDISPISPHSEFLGTASTFSGLVMRARYYIFHGFRKVRDVIRNFITSLTLYSGNGGIFSKFLIAFMFLKPMKYVITRISLATTLTTTLTIATITITSLCLGLFSVSNTYASSISVAISGEMNLNLLASNEGMFGTSTPTTISVLSSNSSGYTLTVTGDRNDGKLVGNNPNNYFTNITNTLTEAEFNTEANNGKWGILPSKYNSETNTFYHPAPTSTNPVTIDTTNTANHTANNYTLAVAARANTGTGSMTLADEYTGTFTLAATGNATDYDIAYVDYDSGLPGLTSGASSTGYATLSSTIPTKPGYEFAGWCTVPVTTGAACTGTTYAASSDYTLSSGDNNVTLYAIWDPVTFAEAFGSTAMNMQNMTTSICNAVAIGQEATLTDTRSGNKTYKVGKLKDGRCWMLDNLALGGNNAINLTTNDTNIAANWTLPASTTSGFNTYTEARINIAYNNTVPSDSMSTAGGWKIGTYYNYCAASAGTYCSAVNTVGSTPVTVDICPNGWRMPSGGIGGEYQVAYDAYGEYNSFRAAMHLPLSGDYGSNQVYGQGNYGSWWSSSFYNNQNMYRLYINSYGGIALQASYYREQGLSMRCIAK